MSVSARPYNPDFMMQRIMNLGRGPFTTTVSEFDVADVIAVVYHILLKQPTLIRCQAPIKILGDIHGQFNDLMRIFNTAGWPPRVNYLFLGDYIDRGRWSIETITLLFCLKIKFPLNFFLLRGNHETIVVNRIYGFYDDIVRRYGTPRLFYFFQEAFSVLPLAAIVSNRIFCMHGGLSPVLLRSNSIEVINEVVRPLPMILSHLLQRRLSRHTLSHNRIQEPLNPSLAMDLLWADPDCNITWFQLSIRGVSGAFGPDVVNAVLQKYGFDLIVRAHQVVQDGYEFFQNKKLVTIFSAPHYCGEFDNAAAILSVTKHLKCSFKTLRPLFPSVSSTFILGNITTYQRPT